MTTTNLMSLPIDIPWRRLGTSGGTWPNRQTLDTMPPGKRLLPSVSIFYYEPEQDLQVYEDRTISYVKISCSITGIENWWSSEKRRTPRGQPGFLMPFVRERTIQYYPCFGAMIEVVAFLRPEDKVSDWVQKSPYFIDFEPKRRELYFSATEGVEYLSSSRSGLEVKKSITTTNTTETRHDVGVNIGVSGGGDNGSFTGGLRSSSGTTFGSSLSVQHMSTSDFSREKRESYSFTTNLTHVYHLLDSYNVGTNRVFFFIQPRPHIQDVQRSLVNGPRKLEGIQEFFLIVDRPSDVPGICLEATLETAHLDFAPVLRAILIEQADLAIRGFADRTAAALNLKGTIYYDQELEDAAALWNGIDPGDRMKVLGTDIGAMFWPYGKTFADFQKPDPDPAMEKPQLTKEQFDAIVTVVGWFGLAKINGSQDVAVVYTEGEADSGAMWVAAQRARGCHGPTAIEMMRAQREEGVADQGFKDSVVYENVLGLEAPFSRMEGWEVQVANAAVRVVADELRASLSSPNRRSYGELGIEDAQFVQQPRTEAVMLLPDGHSYNQPVGKIKGIDGKLKRGLVKAFGVKSRKEAVALGIDQLQNNLDLSEGEARRLRRQLIGEGPDLGVRSEEMSVVVPNIIGMEARAVKRTLEAHGLRVRQKTEEESPEPLGTAIRQIPNAGDIVGRGQVVAIVVSRGFGELRQTTDLDLGTSGRTVSLEPGQKDGTARPSGSQPNAS